jgi:hypothetical protein
MSWGKGLIIFLGLMQLSHVAYARDIESFTDSQGILHITNTGSKQQGSMANPPSPAAPPHPSRLPQKAPSAPPAREPAPRAQAPAPKPEAQAPAPKPEAVPGEPVPVVPQSGSRVTHPEGSGGVMPAAMAWRPGFVKAPSGASAPMVVAQRDRRGVVHIFTYAPAAFISDQDSPVNFLGQVSPALAGYNTGYHRVISAGCQVPASEETQEFVTQVTGLYCLPEKHASGL